MQTIKSVGWVFLLYVLTIGAMVAAAYAWVWFYSVAINTTGDQAFYEAYAQTASPVVAVITALPVFYLMGLFLRRFDQALTLALAVLGIHWAVEVLVLFSIENPLWMLPYSIASALLKAAGAWLALKRSGQTAST